MWCQYYVDDPGFPNTSDNSLHPFNNKLGILFICMLIPSLCRYNKRLDLLKKAFPSIQRIAFSHTQIHRKLARHTHAQYATWRHRRRQIRSLRRQIRSLRRQIRFLRRQIRSLRRQISFFTSANTKSTSANKASKSANKYYVSFPVYVFLLRTACHTSEGLHVSAVESPTYQLPGV